MEKWRDILLTLCLVIISLSILLSFSPSYAEIKFEDVTEVAGILHNNSTYGSAWADFNDDGWPDLWQGNHGIIGGGSKILINNKNGTFFDVVPNLGLESVLNRDNHGASWIDFDNDGDQDLLVLVGAQKGIGEGPNIFLVNDEGILEEKAVEYGIDYPLGRGRMPLWFDWNGDGLLDVLLTNDKRPDGLAPSILFAQTQSGFQKVTTLSEIKKVSILKIFDITLDGKPDLFSISNPPFVIDDLITFSVRDTESKMAFDSEIGSDVTSNFAIKGFRGNDIAIADFNGDLLPDIFITSGYVPTQILTDVLFFNNGTDFEFSSFRSGHNIGNFCNGVGVGDFDNDLDLDIITVCSDVKENREGITGILIKTNILYENFGNGTFTKVDNAGGAIGTPFGFSGSVSIADYDNDGFLDIYVTNGISASKAPGPSQLFRNIGNDNNWIEIDLVGTISNRDGIGSRVLITTENLVQVREQTGGMHFRAQDHQRIHVGLGQHQIIDNIVVFWPSGIVQGIKNISANQIMNILEPERSLPPKQQTSLGIQQNSVKCNFEFDLVLKSSTGDVRCVKPHSVQALVERGWAVTPN